MRRLTLLALFLAYALIMGIVERWFPVPIPVPGVKLGLANVVVLCALYLFSAPQALLLVVLKCVLTSLFAGSFTALAYSLGGSLLSFAGMLLCIRVARGALSPVGVSVVGAVLHNVGQVLAAGAVMETFLVLSYLPALLVSGVAAGVVVGVLVRLLLPVLKRLAKAYYEKRDA